MHESRGNVGQMNLFGFVVLTKGQDSFSWVVLHFISFRLPGRLTRAWETGHVFYVSLGLNFCLHFRPFTGPVS
jgi:hypothetical protein